MFIQYQHNQQSHISYDVVPSILPNTASILPCMTLVVHVTTLLTYTCNNHGWNQIMVVRYKFCDVRSKDAAIIM